jgi:hypothetical protein
MKIANCARSFAICFYFHWPCVFSFLSFSLLLFPSRLSFSLWKIEREREGKAARKKANRKFPDLFNFISFSQLPYDKMEIKKIGREIYGWGVCGGLCLEEQIAKGKAISPNTTHTTHNTYYSRVATFPLWHGYLQ